MEDEYLSMDNVITEEDSSEETTSDFNEEAFELSSIKIQGGDIVRIEEKVGVGWTGVKSCNHTSRINREVKSALKKWVKEKMYEHRNWRWVKYGAKAGTVRCSQRRDRWTGVRSCGCSGRIPFYIEFRKI